MVSWLQDPQVVLPPPVLLPLPPLPPALTLLPLPLLGAPGLLKIPDAGGRTRARALGAAPDGYVPALEPTSRRLSSRAASSAARERGLAEAEARADADSDEARASRPRLDSTLVRP